MVGLLPWVAYPLGQSRSNLTLVAVFGLAAASMSIVGIVLVVVVLATMVWQNRRDLSGGFLVVSAAVVGVVALFVVGIYGSRLGQRIDAPLQDESILVRLRHNAAALQVISSNPIFGIGWWNDIFYIPELVANSTDLWEIRRNLQEGASLTARSLMLRLATYIGLPLVAVLVFLAGRTVSGPSYGGQYDLDRGRTRFVLVMLLVGGVLDGGILTSFYLWVTPAISLGLQMRTRPIVTPNTGAIDV